MNDTKKLNLGCGDRKIHGFINVDIDENVEPDILSDIIKLETIKEKSVSVVYACHVLEHLDYNTSVLALHRWYEILENGGILRLAVPDLEKVCAHFLLYKDLKVVRSFFWGGQHDEFDYHKTGWNFESLKQTLSNIGFKKIERYNHTETDHYYIDDYSQCYLPHLDKKNGMLMSLNIQCEKQ